MNLKLFYSVIIGLIAEEVRVQKEVKAPSGATYFFMIIKKN